MEDELKLGTLLSTAILWTLILLHFFCALHYTKGRPLNGAQDSLFCYRHVGLVEVGECPQLLRALCENSIELLTSLLKDEHLFAPGERIDCSLPLALPCLS